MKLAAICCTYLRPHLLGHLIESFLRQDYPRDLRELVILDDAGQYDDEVGDGWRLISVSTRFATLGEKRNACAAMTSPDVDGFLVADDDDIYLPHWFSAHAEALKLAEWSRPSKCLSESGEELREHPTNGLFHASWAFRRSAFDRVGGYRSMNNGEDQEIAHRLVTAGVTQYDPCAFAKPFFVHRFTDSTYHLSAMEDNGYAVLGQRHVKEKAELKIGWPRDYTTSVPARRFAISSTTTPRDGKPLVELIGPVRSPGGDGPTNGMWALQKALQERIDSGLDWLSIKPLSASRGAIPWFWHWDDRRYAASWDSEGKPFIQGPNMLFIHSGSPRIDQDECALLDASNCQAMFCHSEWYRDLIAQHRGPTNQSPIVLWAYPIEPWPGEPLPDEHDLLIYRKNGYSAELVDHLSKTFPRHKQIVYGHYRREELFETARRSRACVYLADDEHGGLALQEILLAGCPSVGVRTGAPFVEHGVTGQRVNRLPNGLSANDSDMAELQVLQDSIRSAMDMDRRGVRMVPMERFSKDRIVDLIVNALDAARNRVASINCGHGS